MNKKTIALGDGFSMGEFNEIKSQRGELLGVLRSVYYYMESGTMTKNDRLVFDNIKNAIQSVERGSL